MSFVCLQLDVSVEFILMLGVEFKGFCYYRLTAFPKALGNIFLFFFVVCNLVSFISNSVGDMGWLMYESLYNVSNTVIDIYKLFPQYSLMHEGSYGPCLSCTHKTSQCLIAGSAVLPKRKEMKENLWNITVSRLLHRFEIAAWAASEALQAWSDFTHLKTPKVSSKESSARSCRHVAITFPGVSGKGQREAWGHFNIVFKRN